MEKEINREKIIVKTSIIGILLNLVLVIFKAIVGIISNSISIINDAINNLTDALSSLITIVGTKLSLKRADRKHPFGYGRVEYLTQTLISCLILFAGCSAIYESIKSIIDHFKNNTLPEFNITSLIIIGAAIIVKLFVGLFFKYKAKIVESDALASSGTDSLFDCILSLSTLIGAILSYTLHIYIEGYLGIIIGVFILKAGISSIQESLSSILGKRYDKDYIITITNEISSIEGVNGVYDLILHSYGPNKNIGSVHIGVSDSATAKEIQYIERKISRTLLEKYNIIMTTGIYALNEDNEISINIKKTLLEELAKYDTILQMHGFYVDLDMKYCNFDLVIDFTCKDPFDLITKIKTELENKFKEYNFYINYDIDFSITK